MGFEPIGVYKAVGFKAGDWRSVLWLARQLEGVDPPPRPLWLPEIDPENWKRPSLHSARLELRPLGPADGEAMLAYITREKLRLQSAFPVMTKSVTDRESAEAFLLNKVRERYRRISFSFGIHLEEHLVGTLSLKHFDWNVPKADAGYSLAAAWEGRGLGSEALQLALDFAREQLGLRRLFLRIHPENRGSQRVAEKCGFQLEGRIRNDFLDGHGQAQDVLFYSVCF